MLSLIVSWRDRIELLEALPSMMETIERCSGDLTVVNFGGSKTLLGSQLRSYAAGIKIVQVENQQYFNKSYAQNLGAFHSENSILFFCDCDIILEPCSVLELAKEVDRGKGIFATLAGVRESKTNSRGANNVVSFGYELRIQIANGRTLRIVDNEENAEDGTRHAPGLLLVHRNDFLSVDGYNSRLIGWGWEDQDMIARLTLGGGCRRITGGRAIHISHDDKARIAHYPVTDRWESRDRMFRQALRNYDEGNFQGTYSTDTSRISALLCTGDKL